MNFDYLYIFLQSSFIECFIYGFGYRRRLCWLNAFVLTTLANSITHPIVFFGFMSSHFTYLSAILAAELFAVVAETLLHSWFGRLPLPLAFRMALIANLMSWQVAPILTYFLFLA
jgi:hypothetical protein